jgi:hypothetical protein
MKLCCTCKEDKPVSLFYKNKTTKDGLYKQCIACVKHYYVTNKTIINLKNNQYYQNNKEKHLQKSKEYREQNKEYLKEHKQQYYQNNKFYFIKKSKERQKRIKQATPCWESEKDRQHITSVYNLAMLYSWITDSPWHVDHVIPLKGKIVCGLHVPLNLEPVPASYNLSKGAKYCE